MESHYVECMCTDLGHTVRFSFDPSDGELWLDVHLHRWQPWYKRIVMAFRYVFGFAPSHGHYDTTIIDLGDATRIRDLMDRAVKAHDAEDLTEWTKSYQEYIGMFEEQRAKMLGASETEEVR